MRWFEKPEVLSYIIQCYQGTDHRKRQFIWEEPNGDIVIGNSRAFTDHMSARFHLDKPDTAWIAVHQALRELGEVVEEHAPRTKVRNQRFINQQPEVRIIRRKT